MSDDQLDSKELFYEFDPLGIKNGEDRELETPEVEAGSSNNRISTDTGKPSESSGKGADNSVRSTPIMGQEGGQQQSSDAAISDGPENAQIDPNAEDDQFVEASQDNAGDSDEKKLHNAKSIEDDDDVFYDAETDPFELESKLNHSKVEDNLSDDDMDEFQDALMDNFEMDNFEMDNFETNHEFRSIISEQKRTPAIAHSVSKLADKESSKAIDGTSFHSSVNWTMVAIFVPVVIAIAALTIVVYLFYRKPGRCRRRRSGPEILNSINLQSPSSTSLQPLEDAV